MSKNGNNFNIIWKIANVTRNNKITNINQIFKMSSRVLNDDYSTHYYLI